MQVTSHLDSTPGAAASSPWQHMLVGMKQPRLFTYFCFWWDFFFPDMFVALILEVTQPARCNTLGVHFKAFI